MPPTESISNRQMDVTLSALLARSSRFSDKKEIRTATSNRSPKGSGKGGTLSRKSSLVRITSPLTPWREEEEVVYEKKRKGSLKCSGKSKNNKDKKTKKESNKGSKKGSSTDGQEIITPKSTFRYYPDITQYMNEYRQVRNRVTAGHRNCACHGLYGQDEIDKVYENLGLPRILYRLKMHTGNQATNTEAQSDAYCKTLVTHEETQENESKPEKSEDELEEDENGQDRLISSPDARKLKRNLNLSPLRKQVRLPDVRKYPVQSVSGLNMQEVVRLATARGEYRKEESTNNYTPKLRYTSMDRHQGIVFPPFRIHEKTMCRVVELSLPNYLPNNSMNPLPSKQTTSITSSDSSTQSNAKKILLPLDVEVSVNNSDDNSEKQKYPSRNEGLNISPLEKYNEIEDPLLLAIGSSRSNQSSVLSHAVSSLDNGGVKSVTTVREMLTAAVRDLQPFGVNGVIDSETQKSASLASEESEMENNIKSTLDKQIVPSKAYRNLGYKPSMRKFLQELYTPSNDSPALLKFKHNSSLITGKQLNNPIPSDNLQREPDSIFAPSTVLSKRRKRTLAGDNCESIRRVVALKSEKTKLAIFSKCHTVVRPGVSVRGITLT